MKYAVTCLVALTGLIGLGVAQAQSNTTPYTYFEGSFQGSTFNANSAMGAVVPTEDVDGNGPRFELSVALHENVYVFGNAERVALDDFNALLGVTPVTVTGQDIDTWGAGIGINTALTGGRVDRNYRAFSDRFTVFLDGQYLNGGASDDNGFAFDLGFRAINSTRLEFIASAGIEKFEGLSSALTLEGRLLYRLVGNLQIQGGVDWKSEEYTKLFLGLRWGIPEFAVFKDRR
jgi:hypothetical protein